MVWVAIAALVVAAAIIVVVARRSGGETFVLGQQMAVAHANEAARLASGSVAPSPMPKGEYDQESGDDDFAAVAERPLDKELQGLVRAFKGWTPEKRAEARGGISMHEQYTLIHFAKRCSVLALNERSTARAEDGLLAVAMIDETRIDPRDGAWAVGLLAHALEVAGTDGQRVVSEAAALATPAMAKIVMGAREGSRLSEWGYAQIQNEHGDVGLVRSGFERYEPTIDMTALALRLAASLRHGRYIADPELAAEVPVIWFEKAHRSSAEQLLMRALGSVSVNGKLRRAYTNEPFSQQFVQWVVEMPSAEDARTLARYVGVNTRLGGQFVIGVASGRLFSLLVAGSVMEGVAPFETRESLAPLVDQTRALLQEASR